MKNRWIRLLCALLASLLVLACASCAGDPTPTPAPNPTPGPGENDDPPSPGPGENDPPAPTPVVTYGRGADIEGAGFTPVPDAFAMTAHNIDVAGATEASAGALADAFRDGGFSDFIVYHVTEAATISGLSDLTCNGKFATVVADAGLTFENCSGLVLENILFIGEISFVGCTDCRLNHVDLSAPDGVALTTAETTTGLWLSDCRVSGKTALSLGGPAATVLDSAVLFTETGLSVTGAELTVRRTAITGTGTGARIAAADANLMYNRVDAGEDGTGILFASGTLNGMAAMNVLDNSQISVAFNGADNAVAVRNSLVSVKAENSIHIYVCDNEMGGRFIGNNVNYLLADGNVCPDDGKDHTAEQTALTNTNGDTLMDVDARLEVGADERLLPHVDPDQFVGYAARKTVRDPEATKEYSITNYVINGAKDSPYVFVAPGVYASDTTWGLSRSQNDTTIYAYGVYAVREANPGQFANFSGAQNITVKGLTFANRQQSCGQVYVLDKLGNGKLKVITGAGMLNAFGNTDPSFSNVTGMGAQHPGTFYAWCDTSFASLVKNTDGTMTMTVNGALYSSVEPGEVFTCRINANSGLAITNSSGIKFMDFTLYGAAGALAFYEGNNDSTVTYYRVLDTTRSGEIIDEATYNRYKSLEEEYDVDLEISIDEKGRFRGSPAHIGSIDATHVVACTVGSTVISCLFENMCDDGTNQHAHHARLAGYKDNGDGTMTITYKTNLSQVSAEGGTTAASGKCADFHIGERIFIYTSRGQLVCDTHVLTATKTTGTGSGNGVTSFTKFEVKIPSKDEAGNPTFNASALIGFDLNDNAYQATNKVLVDNMSRQSNGYTFDNMMVRNIRSRALLIKASDGKIVNCTFEHIGMACAAILYEIYWGESGVTENLIVDRNLFTHTGYFKNQDLYAPLSITGLGASTQEDYLLYKNISITNNVFEERTTDYCVYVNSAKDIAIKNNDFGTRDEDPFLKTIHLNGAVNVEISDNIYPKDADLDATIVCQHIKNVFGTDATEEDGTPLFPDKD